MANTIKLVESGMLAKWTKKVIETRSISVGETITITVLNEDIQKSKN